MKMLNGCTKIFLIENDVIKMLRTENSGIKTKLKLKLLKFKNHIKL
jgi:hypothetical protein